MEHSNTPVQLAAADPSQSVWLTAHAGTGKTKVLVDRLLRLLLMGESPGSIVAITYTKAAAAEMQIRLRGELTRWSGMDDEALHHTLAVLCGAPPDEALLPRARGLLLDVLEANESLRIVTIHAFCQSLLSRFPLEAGLSHAFEPMDERARLQLLAEAKAALLSTLERSHMPEVAAAMRELSKQLGDAAIDQLIDAFISRSDELFPLWQQAGGLAAYTEAVRLGLDLTNKSEQDWLAERPLKDEALADLLAIASGGSANDQKWAKALEEAQEWEAYACSFLTADYEKTKHIWTKKLREAHSQLYAQLRQEQDWAYAFVHWRLCERVAELSVAAATVGLALQHLYYALKSQRGLLDYSDLIGYTLNLLSRPGYCEWVLSKLDYRLKHLLLDEAQDTSPEQWQLLGLLKESLFLPELYDETPRTLFVVGDAKQSIYRFQGADPQGYQAQEQNLREWFDATGQPFVTLGLAQSFRSTEAVLSLVDHVCADPMVFAAIQEEAVLHAAHRSGLWGMVSLWPVLEKPDKEMLPPPWEQPGAIGDMPGAADRELAAKLAEHIASRLQRGDILPARGRALAAGDILILVQRRNAFAGHLSRALQVLGVPVAGADRVILSAHLAVQDVLALADWCLLPSDDLALATVLKGPLFAWDEAALFSLAHERGEARLWDCLKQQNVEMADRLEAIRSAALSQPPYEWLIHLLYTQGMLKQLRHRFGLEVNDIADELCRQALACENQHGRSLQFFVQWMQCGEVAVKREMEQGAGAVRIMTVHGAKGLQAPWVILPDTLRIPDTKDTVIWKRVSHITAGYVTPQGLKKPAALKRMQQEAKAEDRREYYRLLYVALTRAQDELLICGFNTKKNIADESWYARILASLKQLGAQELEDGSLQYACGIPAVAHGASENKALASGEFPRWWYAPIPPEGAAGPVIRAPSQLLTQSAPQMSEMADANGATAQEAISYGNATHYLLQCIPGGGKSLDQARLEKLARWVLPQDESHQSLFEEVLAVIEEHGWLFGPGSFAELPVQGDVLWQNRRTPLRGQIDRVVIHEQMLSIVDYKSNRQLPEQIPEAYQLQLACYVALLRPLYPKHTIRAGLLYTRYNCIEWADISVLESICQPCFHANGSHAKLDGTGASS